MSTAAGVANIGSAIPIVGEHPVWFCVGIIVLISGLNLRGMKESGSAFAIPVYAFIFSMYALLITGLLRWATGSEMRAASADYELQPEHALSGLALVFLLARGFSSGSAALTGVEAISNGVPAFKKPKSRNAATTLAVMAALSVTMMLGLVALTMITGAQIAEDPAQQLLGAPDGYYQKTLIAQIAETVFSGFPLAFYLVSFTTGLILLLACNTAFNGFPVLGSILAQDRFLPRQLHTRGDRLAFSNGIVFLAGIALILVIAFQADVTALIQLYIVGVFVSFTCSQAGMIRHWKRLLGTEKNSAVRRRMRRSQAINAVGFFFTSVVLLIVLITKFLAGAWIAILAMGVIFFTMKGIQRHYQRVTLELAADEDDMLLPSRVHSIVLVSRLHMPTMRALAYARATRPDYLEAVTGQRRPRRHRGPGPGMGGPEHPRRVEGHRLTVPGNHQTHPRLRAPHPERQPAGHRHRVHPRIRRRALVGTPAAQPIRAAPQGQVAVHPRGDGHLRALAAVLLRRPGRTTPSTHRPSAHDPRTDYRKADPHRQQHRPPHLAPGASRPRMTARTPDSVSLPNSSEADHRSPTLPLGGAERDHRVGAGGTGFDQVGIESQ